MTSARSSESLRSLDENDPLWIETLSENQMEVPVGQRLVPRSDDSPELGKAAVSGTQEEWLQLATSAGQVRSSPYLYEVERLQSWGSVLKKSENKRGRSNRRQKCQRYKKVGQ